MRMLRISLLFFAGLLLTNACKKNKQDTATPEPTTDYATKEIIVTLPKGSTLTVEKLTAFANGVSTKVNSNGKVKIPFNNSGREIVTVFDDKENLLLMGFISEKNSEISIKTTTDVLIYYSSSIPFMNSRARTLLADSSSLLPHYADLVAKMEQQFITDPTFISNGGFAAPLKNWYDTHLKVTTIDIAGRSIMVEPTDFKSGLQVYSIDSKNIQVTQKFRRRGHAYLYKTGFRDKLTGTKQIQFPTITNATAIKKQFGIDPVPGVRDVFGTIADAALGKGAEFAEKKSDPVELPIESTEKEAYYKLRIVAPSINPNTFGLDLTQFENNKLDELWIEFFCLDIALPLLMDILDHKGILENEASALTPSKKEVLEGVLLKSFSAFISTYPDLVTELKKGEIKKAATEFLYSLSKSAGTTLLADFSDAVYNISLARFNAAAISNPKLGKLQEMTKNNAAKFAKIVEVINVGLKLIDYGRIYDELLNSNKMEEWDLTVRDNDVKLTPKEDVITTGVNHVLTANTETVLADGESFVYKWKTTGKYGTIKDAVHTGTEFESSAKSVTYRSTVSNASLKENNIENIYVTILIKKGQTLSEIGSDTATVNLRPVKLVMRPVDKKLSPKDGIKSVRMYLVRSDGTDDFAGSASSLDYKFEWSTTGKYGKFYGSLKNATTYKPEVNYEALDRDVRNAWETVTVHVYFKAKNETRWILREKVEGRVNIINDPKIIILHTSVVLKDTLYFPQPTSVVVQAWQHAVVKQHPEAKKYTVRFYGFRKSSNDEGYSLSWNEGQKPNAPFPMYSATNSLLNGGYYIGIGYSHANGPCGANSTNCGQAALSNYRSVYGALGGSAEITIELK